MSTFGEISEPMSRTSWEDWDDIENSSEGSGLQWKNPLQLSDNIDTLFILEGKFLSDCLVIQPKNHLNLINSVLEVNLNLYQIRSSEQYVCSIRDYNLLQSSEIVELLKPILSKSTNVLTIQTKPLIQYQAENISSELCIARQLATATPSNKLFGLNYAKLEQPNILSGVAAGAICLRDHMNLSAVALVYYVQHVEEYQTDEIQKLLEKFQIVQSCKAKFTNVLSSNLYI